VSSIRLDEVVALGQTARQTGAAGAALMPPSFFPLSQADILEFFLRAADAIELPFYLYNFPEVTGNRIGLKVIASFAERAPMAGIKQSGSELSYHDDLIRLGREKDFAVFTAADAQLAEFLDKGAAGCVGGVANFLPEYMVEVFEACRQKQSAMVAEKSARLTRAGDIFSPLLLPMNVRSGMEARGFDPGALKTVVSSETLAIYGKVVEDFRQTFAGWKLPFCAS
jgi:4-hydroxy-tetrahydrodipicolinate synthase